MVCVCVCKRVKSGKENITWHAVGGAVAAEVG